MFSAKMVRWSNFELKPAKSHEMGQYGHKGNTAAFHNATVPLYIMKIQFRNKDTKNPG